MRTKLNTGLLKKLKGERFYNIELEKDIENNKIENCLVTKAGYIGNRPPNYKEEFHEDDTWALDIYTEDRFIVTSYLYTSEFEYNKDIEKLES